MKYVSYILFAVFVMLCVTKSSAGQEVDQDGDGLTCVLENDGLYCNEDGQDAYPNIPNLYPGDGVEILDVWPIGNPDGRLTTIDTLVGLGGRSYYLGCLYRERWVTRNQELLDAGLKRLNWADLSFRVVRLPGCQRDYTFPDPLF